MARQALIYALIFFSTNRLAFADVIESIRAGGPSSSHQCGPSEKTNEPPFLISKQNKNIDEQKHTKNISMTEKFGDKQRISPMTLVKINSGASSFVTAHDSDLLNVQVISTPNQAANDEMKTGLKKLRRAIAGDGVQPGDAGHIQKSVLQPIDGFLFSVKTESQLVKFSPEFESVIKDSVIRFADQNGYYSTHSCCEVDPQTQVKSNCKTEYEFEIVDANDPTHLIATAQPRTQKNVRATAITIRTTIKR